MSRIDTIFASHRSEGRKALIAFITGGHPRPNSTADLLRAAQRGGASIVEVGIPFSDPIADGPVIAAAMHDALTGGVTPDAIFEQVARAREDLSIGIVAMMSVSLAFRMGTPTEFARRLKQSGFDGVILPDAPLEEAAQYAKAAKAEDLSLSLLIAPTTPFSRAKEIATLCTGFVYLLTRTGITGESGGSPDVGPRVEKLRQITAAPIACGFGISTADHVRSVVRHADAAIVGSALVRRLTDAHKAGEDPAAVCEACVSELACGLAF